MRARCFTTHQTTPACYGKRLLAGRDWRHKIVRQWITDTGEARDLGYGHRSSTIGTRVPGYMPTGVMWGPGVRDGCRRRVFAPPSTARPNRTRSVRFARRGGADVLPRFRHAVFGRDARPLRHPLRSQALVRGAKMCFHQFPSRMTNPSAAVPGPGPYMIIRILRFPTTPIPRVSGVDIRVMHPGDIILSCPPRTPVVMRYEQP